ncbi:MAG TPA: hypothetical protein IAA05_13550 [Candidatus Blautia excrementipullorum]|nr:hypothetical protein [Candidatus Blautia excrementipullorum]
MRSLVECGIAALGICYWNVDGLPKELVRVPVDPFEKAILWLKNRGYEKIIMYGISKGAELALLCASLMPDICGVVALSRTVYGEACTGIKAWRRKLFHLPLNLHIGETIFRV